MKITCPFCGREDEIGININEVRENEVFLLICSHCHQSFNFIPIADYLKYLNREGKMSADKKDTEKKPKKKRDCGCE